jgi:hypothetical protein
VNQNNERNIASSTVSEILQDDRSLYSTQFALGFRSLTFIPELESGFRQFYLDNNPGQIKRIIPLALILTLLFILAFCYFLAGLRFYHALFSALIISLGYPASQLLFSAPLQNLPFNCFMILAFNVLGLCGAYFLEYTARENYLGR